MNIELTNSLIYNIKLFKIKHSVFSYTLTFKKEHNHLTFPNDTHIQWWKTIFQFNESPNSRLKLRFMDILCQVRSIIYLLKFSMHMSHLIKSYSSLKINILVDPPLVTSGQVGNLLLSLVHSGTVSIILLIPKQLELRHFPSLVNMVLHP